MTIMDEWGPLGDLGRAGDFCGYTDEEHAYADGLLKCMRRDGHAGATQAVDMHLGSLDTHPIFFGPPIEIPPQEAP